MFDRAVIDVLDFTKSASLVFGTVTATTLPRLKDYLATPTESGEIFYSIQGRIDGDGNPRLTIRIDGTLSILCLRCLDPVTWSIKTRREFLRSLRRRSVALQHWRASIRLAPTISKEFAMAVQQNKKSPSKRNMRRAHDALNVAPLAVEPTTGEVHLRHHISPTGFYRGRKVVKAKND